MRASPRSLTLIFVENLLPQLFIVSDVALSHRESPLVASEEVIGEASWSPNDSGQFKVA